MRSVLGCDPVLKALLVVGAAGWLFGLAFGLLVACALRLAGCQQ